MYILLKFDYAKFGVSNLFFSQVIEEKPLGGVGSTPLGKGRVNNQQRIQIFLFLKPVSLVAIRWRRSKMADRPPADLF